MNNPYIEMIEQALAESLPCGGRMKSVIDSMSYSLLSGGKRIRPTLLLSVCESLGGDIRSALPYACAVEMIHAYSLIHDDLPCMDDDELRRGKPSNHIAFGEDIALLAGDALQSLAFETMLSEEALSHTGINGARAAGVLARRCGAKGMVGGQVIDLETEGKDPDLDTIREMYALKTGDLIKAACEMGAVLANADGSTLTAVLEYADCIGLAFQVVDDILDIESDTATLGKPVGSDADNEKVNLVTKLGVKRGRELVGELTEKAVAALNDIGADTSFLEETALALSHRLK